MDLAKSFLDLGARATHPEINHSYFEYAGTDETLQLLVEHGADLHRLVAFQEPVGQLYTEKFPAFMLPTMKSKGKQCYL